MMNDVYYKTGGPLLSTSPDADAYIERESDVQARNHLRRMDYITLIEPRQQGKTSLIYRLMGDSASQDYIFAYADLTTAIRSNEADWYASICSWLLRHTPSLINNDVPTTPTNGHTWLHFLHDLAERAEKAKINLIIVLDEVGATPSDWSTDFFSSIRSIYVQRQGFPCLRYLSFIIAGAFNPRLLIRDPNISNFNVDQRVELPDFTLEQVKQSVARLGLSERQWATVAKRIYHWTGGQPYLTQCLCRALAERRVPRTPRGVTQAVERLRRSDRHHLARILEDLRREPKSAQQYVQRILSGHRPTFIPAEHPTQAQLALIGIIKEGPNGRCVIRNCVYEQALLHPIEIESDERDIEEAGIGNINLEGGLTSLKACVGSEDTETQLTFTNLEARLLANLQEERDYGANEVIRNERTRILKELNRLALTHLGCSFNDLCRV
jgi:hypothetical protein